MAVWIPKNVIRLASKHNACTVNYAIQVCDYSTEPRVIKNPSTASLKRGTGGRSSFNGVVCTVFGATGFVGRYVCNRLGKIGTQLILPYRGDHYDCMRLKLCGDLGQVLFHPFHLKDEESIVKCIKYSNVVINLIGRDYETKNFDYHDVNVEGARRLARLCKENNVERFIHMSNVAASPHPEPRVLDAGSKFLKSKYQGEIAVREEFPEATIIRSSVIYGSEDRFLNTYGSLFRQYNRGVPLWEKGQKTIKRPIHVGDVASGITAIVKDPRTAGKTYQFLGPEAYRLGDIVNWFGELTNIGITYANFRVYDLKYVPIFKLKVYLSEFISLAYPLSNMHWEGIELEHADDKLQEGVPSLEDLGVTPISIAKRMIWECRLHRRHMYDPDIMPESELPKAPPPVA